MLNDVNSNDSSPFDLNDFPQLTSRPSSAGGPQGQLGNFKIYFMDEMAMLIVRWNGNVY